MTIDNDIVDKLINLITRKKAILNADPIVFEKTDEIVKILDTQNDSMLDILLAEKKMEEEMGEEVFYLYVGYAMSIMREDYEIAGKLKKRMNNLNFK